MLGDTDATANLAVRDLDAATRFYEGTLGLQRAGSEGEELIAYRSGNTMLSVYRSEFAGTNKATAVTWDVGDKIGEIVAALRGKGVTFEHYDLPGMTRDGDIHVDRHMKVAWFKDPDGNILNLVGR